MIYHHNISIQLNTALRALVKKEKVLKIFQSQTP